MYDMWFYVNHGRDEMILCQGHYNGDDDEVMPTDHMRHDFNCGKECVACRASETMKDYQLWPPEYQRKTIVKTAARSRAFFNIMLESGNPVTDPQEGLRAVSQGHHPNRWWATKDASTVRSS